MNALITHNIKNTPVYELLSSKKKEKFELEELETLSQM
jgi:hypothetical protein